jgi:hypothetical protein
MEELGLAGEAVGAEGSAEVGGEALAEVALVGVIPTSGGGLGLLMLDMDLVIHTMAMAYRSPMATTHGKGASG